MSLHPAKSLGAQPLPPHAQGLGGGQAGQRGWEARLRGGEPVLSAKSELASTSLVLGAPSHLRVPNGIEGTGWGVKPVGPAVGDWPRLGGRAGYQCLGPHPSSDSIPPTPSRHAHTRSSVTPTHTQPQAPSLSPKTIASHFTPPARRRPHAPSHAPTQARTRRREAREHT